MEYKAYNLFLYEKRKERKQSRKEFAKYLGIPAFLYASYEKGNLFPSKKRIRKIKERLGEEFSAYEKGERTIPLPLPYEKGKRERRMDAFLSSLKTRIVTIVVLCLSLLSLILGYSFYFYNLAHSQRFYSKEYLSFSYVMREKGEKTLGLLHEMESPVIYENKEDVFTCIISSSKDDSLRNLSAYVNFRDREESICYSLPSKASLCKRRISVTYTDYKTMKKYSSFFEREDVDSDYVLDEDIYLEGSLLKEDDSFIKQKMNLHISSIKDRFDALVKEKLNISSSFLDEIVYDYSIGTIENGIIETACLGFASTGLVLVCSSLFFLSYGILYGKRKRTHLLINDMLMEEEMNSQIPLRSDLKSAPFLPEMLFEIIGIFLTFFGIFLVIYNALMMVLGKEALPLFQMNDPSRLFLFFTLGMFLLYFEDFNVYVRPKRIIRNIILYGVSFLCLYGLQATSISYLERNTGFGKIFASLFQIPNTFSSICLYFMIMLFLFITPKKIENNRKKLLIYRLCSLIPTLILFSTIFLRKGFVSSDLEVSAYVSYLFNSEGIQFASICTSYIYGLYFMKLYFIKKLSKEKARRFFFSNRYFMYRNILLCSIIVIFSMLQASFSSLEGYYQILLLVPFLLFYHPHLIRRNKMIDDFTLGNYYVAFGFGYLCVILCILVLFFLL